MVANAMSGLTIRTSAERLIFPAPHLWVPGKKMSPGYPCCCKEGVECTGCSGVGNNAPKEFLVSIRGVANGSCGQWCDPADCAPFNGDFVVVHVPGGTWCTWVYYIGSVVCTYVPGFCGVKDSEIKVRIFRLSDSSARMTVTGGGTSTIGDYSFGWEKLYSPLPNCKTFNAEVIPWGLSLGNLCLSENSTCTVTAL